MQLINPTTNQPIDISTGGGILKINILDYYPEILPLLQNLPSSINKHLNVGQSPKAKQFFSKFNIGLYNSINLDNPISYMQNIDSILNSIPDFGVLQKKVLNMFEIIFDSKIIIPKVNIDGKQCNIPSFVFRSFEPSQEQNISHNTLAIDYHNDDILRDINYKNIHSQNYIKPLNHIDFLTNVDDSTINLDISNSSDFDNMDSRMHKITRDLTQFAFNIVLLPPTVGSITEVLSNDGIDSYAPTKIGDLFIFCCQSPHRIYSSTPTRTTMGGFIVNINSSNKKYIFG